MPPELYSKLRRRVQEIRSESDTGPHFGAATILRSLFGSFLRGELNGPKVGVPLNPYVRMTCVLPHGSYRAMMERVGFFNDANSTAAPESRSLSQAELGRILVTDWLESGGVR